MSHMSHDTISFPQWTQDICNHMFMTGRSCIHILHHHGVQKCHAFLYLCFVLCLLTMPSIVLLQQEAAHY